ncbi:OpgC family protein [Phyllobacterium lublinensis]|uniref:OpgC family protein n=1 Tax=Phyllobacterium lublinensis TaxID=2875708 RepID=UPI001CC98FF9|nr:OpgC domain-containing protein [Phyllobacterium sp. 2063]MBZ9654629.1 OpgC domain-containing protein [Phyllobacterium sp. 2063]
MTQTELKQRDTRIDVFRALALLTIFINHIPGTVYENLTHKNFGFSDSAEAFVLISGIAVGLAYGSKFESGARFLMTLKAWRRAATLYCTHILTTIATLAIFCAAGIYLKRPDFMSFINIGPLVDEPAKAFIGLATMGHQLGYNNILSMYGVLLLMLPAFLLIASFSIPAMVAVSAILWLVSGIYQIAPPNYPTGGVWFLNPLSWQFLFVIGIAGIMHVRRGGSIVFNKYLFGLCVAYILTALVWVRWPLWGVDTSLGLPMVVTGFDKTFLSLTRLAHVLALAYVIASVPAISNLARTSVDHPLALLGKHSLPVFVAGTILAMVAQVVKVMNPGGLLDDTLLIASGIMAQFALAYYLEWLPRIGWGRPVQATKPKPVLTGRPVATPNMKPATRAVVS